MQVFFYFSGHGATIGHDTVMYSDDGIPISFYNCFHELDISNASAVIAILDCCRVEVESEPQDLQPAPKKRKRNPPSSDVRSLVSLVPINLLLMGASFLYTDVSFLCRSTTCMCLPVALAQRQRMMGAVS